MKFKQIEVTIKGNPPGLLMNRCTPEMLTKKQTLKKKEYTAEDDARQSAYIAEVDGKEQLYIPGLNVYTMMVQACSGFKIPNPQGGRNIAARGIIAGIMRISPEKIPLGTDKYEIDVRPAVIQRARIPRARANLPEWEASFIITYDADVISNPNIFREILDVAGFRYGLLDYRPQHMGPFGTFTVTKFDPGEE